MWGIDVSESVAACRRNWDRYHPDQAWKLKLAQADLMQMPFSDESFDIVLSDGVLHHTPDTFQALSAIVGKVKKSGLVVFYVYRKKAPIREFVDDHVREKLSQLSPEDAWRELEPLTKLARELADAHITIKIPASFAILGFEEGNYDLQRWLYWNCMKFYWNDALSLDENNHVNFDWYYPKYAWRHTPEEVRGWLDTLGLTVSRFYVDEAGISVIAVR